MVSELEIQAIEELGTDYELATRFKLGNFDGDIAREVAVYEKVQAAVAR
jgi:hypothetical protein